MRANQRNFQGTPLVDIRARLDSIQEWTGLANTFSGQPSGRGVTPASPSPSDRPTQSPDAPYGHGGPLL